MKEIYVAYLNSSTRPSTTVVDPMLSWFHTLSFSGRRNHGDDLGPPHGACRVDRRHRAGLDAGADGGGATDWRTVYALGRAAACRGVSAGFAQSGRAEKRLATG